MKGIHAAIKSGMLAAEAIFEALLTEEFSAKQLRRYEELINESWIIPELRKVRNFHAAFQRGRWLGLANAGLQFITGGRSWGIFDRAKAEPGHVVPERLGAADAAEETVRVEGPGAHRRHLSHPGRCGPSAWHTFLPRAWG